MNSGKKVFKGSPSFRLWWAVLAAVLFVRGGAGYASSDQASIKIMHLADIGGVEESQLLQPASADFGPDEKIYILNGIEDYIRVYTIEGRFLFSFGEKTSRDGGLLDPLGFHVSRDGKVYVADTGHGRIVVFSHEGTFRFQFKLQPDRYQFPAEPTDIYVNEQTRKCFIADNNNHRVLVYSTEGEYQNEWGQVGYDTGEFRFPFRASGNQDGGVLISDVINTRVQVFSEDGQYQHSLGEWGVELGYHFRPSGLAVDTMQRVYISDGYMGVIQVFAWGGDVIGLLVDEKGQRAVFRSPVDVAVSPEGLLAVTEALANKVSVYRVSIEADGGK